MTITLLPRLNATAAGALTYTQRATIAQVRHRASCMFCHFGSEVTDEETFEACSSKRHCLNGTYFYLPMQLQHQVEIQSRPLFTDGRINPDKMFYDPAPLTRSFKFNCRPHYAQFVVCNADGYTCNSMCVYYPERVAKRQPVATCGKSHGCNCNGSFFDLLTSSTLNPDAED